MKNFEKIIQDELIKSSFEIPSTELKTKINGQIQRFKQKFLLVMLKNEFLELLYRSKSIKE